ncbi:MAG: VOC family protein [Alphaproteobacteria bacterium]|jgi:catechol 2,3-dioxygenase-like lactoylglutathione lyase family enzyme
MPLEFIDHYNVLTKDAAASAKFYVDVLGLRIGDRPPFKFPGAWVYAGDRPVLHLVERDKLPEGKGVVDHVSFRCTGYGEIKQRLEDAGVEYDERVVPKYNLTQLFLDTPDGLKIELTFTEESVAAG